MRKVIRYFFLFLLPLLFGQMIYNFNFPEPFPAIMMPRFGYQHPIKNTIVYKDMDLVFISNNEKKYEINRHELFHTMHLPQRFFAVQKVFGLETNAEEDPGFMQWLRKKIQQITGETEGQLKAVWYDVEMKKEKGQLNSEKQIIGIKTIQF